MLVIGNRAVNKEHLALSRHRDDSVPVFVQLNRVIWSMPVYIDSTGEKTRRYTVARVRLSCSLNTTCYYAVKHIVGDISKELGNSIGDKLDRKPLPFLNLTKLFGTESLHSHRNRLHSIAWQSLPFAMLPWVHGVGQADVVKDLRTFDRISWFVTFRKEDELYSILRDFKHHVLVVP